MKRWVVLVLLVMTSVSVLADSVQTLDGQTLHGTRVSGLPDEIVLSDRGVGISVRANAVASLVTSGETAGIKTTAGRDLSGTLSSDIATVHLQTGTGEVEIPFAQVLAITIDRAATKRSEPSATLTLKDGRSFAGDLGRSFPAEISLSSSGIVQTTRLSAITSLAIGEPTTVETAAGSVSGTLVTNLPDYIVLITDFGAYSIDVDAASEILISKGAAGFARPVVAGGPSNSFGIGLKVWAGIPSAVADLTLGSFGAEIGAGILAASAFGGYANASALFYFASVRYLISVPFLADIARPYFGGGIVGASVTSTLGGQSQTTSIFSVDAFAGVEVSLQAVGVPVTLFAATDWAPLSTDSSVIAQFGARFEFSL